MAPGTFAQLRDASGTPLTTIQIVGGRDRPDLSNLEPRRAVSPATVPTDGVERARGRLLAIELAADGTLLLLVRT